MICNNVGFEPCVERLPMKVDSVAWQTWLRMLAINWFPLCSMIFLYKWDTLLSNSPLQCTRTRPPFPIAWSMNCLALISRQTRQEINNTIKEGFIWVGSHAGKSRIKFCSSLSSTSNTIYLKCSGKRGRTENASFASRIQTLDEKKQKVLRVRSTLTVAQMKSNNIHVRYFETW